MTAPKFQRERRSPGQIAGRLSEGDKGGVDGQFACTRLTVLVKSGDGLFSAYQRIYGKNRGNQQIAIDKVPTAAVVGCI